MKKKKRKCRYLKSMAAVLLSLNIVITVLTGCGRTENISKEDGKTIVTIGYLPITHGLALFEEKELLDQQADSNIQIRLQKFSTWNDLMDALNSGRIDGASVLIELAMGAVSQGIDLKAVALGHRDGNVVVVSDKIKSVSDLKGKTFAIPSKQSSHNILLNDMLKENGVRIEEIEVIQLAPAEMSSSLASGAIDGYCVAEPFGAQAVVNGYGHVLYDSKELWENSICCAFVLNGKFLEGQKETADTLIEKYMEAGNILNNQETAKEVAQKYLGQEEEILDASLEWIHYDELEITKKNYDILAEKVKGYGINEKTPEYKEFVYQP